MHFTKRAPGFKSTPRLLSGALITACLAAAASGAPMFPETSDPGAALVESVTSPLLAIDRNRATVVDRIVGDWSEALVKAHAGIDPEQLRALLLAMRADHLLAASLAGSLDGLRNVIAASLVSEAEVKPSLLQAKSLGDPAADLVYTPVSPCRLFDTRSSQGGLGTPALNVRRTYGAITPVTNQGGPGGCAAGTGATVALIEIGTLTPGGAGFLQGGAQGVASFPNALLLYQAGDQYGTGVAMPLNPANGRFDLVEQFSTADLYGDLLGYFRAPQGGFVTSVTAGAGLIGGTITSSGTIGVDTSVIQSRVHGTCAAGSSIRTIGIDGSVVCEADDVGGAGTVTQVNTPLAGGLTGGPITATGSLSIAAGGVTAAMLASNSCSANQIMKWTGSAWTCQADANSGGTVTSITAGTGLTGGAITTSGTINLAATQLLPTVACFTGQEPRWNGIAWSCADPSNFAGNIAMPDSASQSVGNITKAGNVFLHNFGTNNTFVGKFAGNFSSGPNNTGIGTSALHANGAGSFNVATGGGALQENTSGSHNTATGYVALAASTTGDDNTATGYGALNANTTGAFNTAAGSNALISNTTGIENVAAGYFALESNGTGNFNVGLGNSALRNNTIAHNNVAVGYSALFNSTGSRNIAIGNQAGSGLTTGHDNIDIGNIGTAGEGRTIRLGNSADHDRTFIAGIRSVATGNANAVGVVIDSNGQLGTISSSRRFKDDILNMGSASSSLMQLRPVTFHYKADRDKANRPLQYGLVAEEVADVYPGLVARGADGRIETVMYQFLAPMLLNEYQKQQRTIEVQTSKLAELQLERSQLADEVAELRRSVEVLLARAQVDAKVASASAQ